MPLFFIDKKSAVEYVPSRAMLLRSLVEEDAPAGEPRPVGAIPPTGPKGPSQVD